MDLRENDVLLRYLADEDRISLADLVNNRKVLDNLRDMIPYPYTKKDAQVFIDRTKKESPQLTFAIQFREDLCGVIGLVPQQDVYRRSTEIGYWIGEPFWGNNIATMAVKLVTAYAFAELNFVRIYAGVFEFNIGSMRVLEKNGYQKDGIFRKAIIKHDKIWDEHRYSITK